MKELPQVIYVQRGSYEIGTKHEDSYLVADETVEEAIEAHVGDDGKPGDWVGVYELKKVIRVLKQPPLVEEVK